MVKYEVKYEIQSSDNHYYYPLMKEVSVISESGQLLSLHNQLFKVMGRVEYESHVQTLLMDTLHTMLKQILVKTLNYGMSGL